MKQREKMLGHALILHLLLTLIEGRAAALFSVLAKSTVLPSVFSLLFTPVRFLLPLFIYCKASGYRPFSPYIGSKTDADMHSFISPFGGKFNIAEHRFSSPADAKADIGGRQADLHEIQKKSPSAKSLALLFLFALPLTVFILNTFGYLTDSVLSLLGREVTATAPTTAPEIIYSFIKSVVFAAFFEEMLFRGTTLHAFSHKNITASVLLSALLFALMHYNLYQLFYAFAAGVVIAFFASVTGSLLFSVLLHLGANLVTFVFSLLLPRLSEKAYTLSALTVYIICAAVSTVFFLIYLLKLGQVSKKEVTKAKDALDIPKESIEAKASDIYSKGTEAKAYGTPNESNGSETPYIPNGSTGSKSKKTASENGQLSREIYVYIAAALLLAVINLFNF